MVAFTDFLHPPEPDYKMWFEGLEEILMEQRRAATNGEEITITVEYPSRYINRTIDVVYVPERTCKVVKRDRDEYGEFAEYSCGHANVWQSWNEPSYCCWCGARVLPDA